MTQPLSEQIEQIVRRLTEYMNIACDVTVSVPEDDEAPLAVAISAPESANLLIGKNGQNLHALEHVLRAVLARQQVMRPMVVDVNDYRQVKAQQLIELVRQAAGRVRDGGKPEALPPMTSYERRIVHTELASWSDVATESIGQDPQRRVVIRPV